MQNTLVYWSQYYDFVYDSHEKPAPMIIEDDDALDAWVNDALKSRGSSAGSGKQKRNMFGSKKASQKKSHQEQFVMVQPGNQESIDRVQDMNTSTVRRQLRSENARLKQSKGKRVSEWQLRKGQYLRQMQGKK